MIDPMTTLSPAAERRRIELRARLLPVVVRRRRLRQARSLAIAVVAGALAWRTIGGSAPAARVPTTEPVPLIAVVRDDPAVVARYRIDVDDRVVRLGDADLAAVLTAAGRVEGLLRVDGRMMLAGLVVDSWMSAHDGP